MLADSKRMRRRKPSEHSQAKRKSFHTTEREESSPKLGPSRQDVANANTERLPQPEPKPAKERSRSRASERTCAAGGSWWATEPELGRVANGIPNRTHRLKGLGNAIVPQIAQIIGQAINQIEQGQSEYTQREVAESAGLTPDWVNHFEAGRRLPTIPILIALCDALEVSADRILGL
jgi:DNA-binding XRE family transcriptional regulator